MRDFQQRRTFRRLAESKLALVVLAGILVFSMWNLAVFWRKMNETAKNRKLAEERATTLAESKKSLEAQVSKLQTERGVEEVLREDFGLTREGEGVIIVVEDEDSQEGAETKNKGFWGWLQSLF